jgi:hypothetical protein
LPAKSKGNYKELKHIVAEQDEDIKNGNASENAATTSGKPPPLYHKQSGIIGHDIAPTSRAVCFLCGEQIQKKTPRFEYVHEETGRKGVIMSAPRYIHDECVKYITLPSPKPKFDTLPQNSAERTWRASERPAPSSASKPFVVLACNQNARFG